MLNTISWQQYFAALFLLSIAWYAYVGLRYYQPVLNRLAKVKPNAPGGLPPVAGRFHDVMGSAKPDAGQDSLAPEELMFAAAEPDDISDQTIPAGPADDLLAEAKVLIETYGRNTNKGNFLSLFQVLLDKYEVYSDEISLPAVIRPLREFADGRLAFPLKETEWPLTFNSAAL